MKHIAIIKGRAIVVMAFFFLNLNTFAESLDTTSGYGEIPGSEDFLSEQFTLEAKVKITEEVTDYHFYYVLSKWGAEDDGKSWSFGLRTIGDVVYEFIYLRHIDADHLIEVPIGNIEEFVDKVVHLAVVVRNTHVQFFKNGLFESQSLSPPPTPNESDSLIRVGTRNGEGATFPGCLDDIRIWGIPRAEEYLYGGLNSLPEDDDFGLLGLWQFDDESLSDLSGNHVDMVLDGAGFCEEIGDVPKEERIIEIFADLRNCESRLIGDINGDGAVNGLDIEPFVEILVGGDLSPEEKSLVKEKLKEAGFSVGNSSEIRIGNTNIRVEDGIVVISVSIEESLGGVEWTTIKAVDIVKGLSPDGTALYRAVAR